MVSELEADVVVSSLITKIASTDPQINRHSDKLTDIRGSICEIIASISSSSGCDETDSFGGDGSQNKGEGSQSKEDKYLYLVDKSQDRLNESQSIGDRDEYQSCDEVSSE